MSGRNHGQIDPGNRTKFKKTSPGILRMRHEFRKLVMECREKIGDLGKKEDDKDEIQGSQGRIYGHTRGKSKSGCHFIHQLNCDKSRVPSVTVTVDQSVQVTSDRNPQDNLEENIYRY